MELGEMTETKKAAIMSTLRKNSSRLCEGVSITCLVAILYSNDVTGSLVFSGLSTAPHKTNYLVQEILTAVEEEPQKFEAVCSSLELAHSAEFGQHLWSEYFTMIIIDLMLQLFMNMLLFPLLGDYERELEVLEAGGEFLDERLVMTATWHPMHCISIIQSRLKSTQLFLCSWWFGSRAMNVVKETSVPPCIVFFMNALFLLHSVHALYFVYCSCCYITLAHAHLSYDTRMRSTYKGVVKELDFD